MPTYSTYSKEYCTKFLQYGEMSIRRRIPTHGRTGLPHPLPPLPPIPCRPVSPSAFVSCFASYLRPCLILVLMSYGDVGKRCRLHRARDARHFLRFSENGQRMDCWIPRTVSAHCTVLVLYCTAQVPGIAQVNPTRRCRGAELVLYSTSKHEPCPCSE